MIFPFHAFLGQYQHYKNTMVIRDGVLLFRSYPWNDVIYMVSFIIHALLFLLFLHVYEVAFTTLVYNTGMNLSIYLSSTRDDNKDLEQK